MPHTFDLPCKLCIASDRRLTFICRASLQPSGLSGRSCSSCRSLTESSPDNERVNKCSPRATPPVPWSLTAREPPLEAAPSVEPPDSFLFWARLNWSPGLPRRARAIREEEGELSSAYADSLPLVGPLLHTCRLEHFTRTFRID